MRYTEIDGKRYEVKTCEECPFRDMGDDGYGAHCTHPVVYDPYKGLPIKDDGSIPERCPLRMKTAKEPGLSQHLAQCPYCYGRSMLVHYVCDGPSCTFDTYRVECTECGASTLDHNAKTVKLMWELGQIGKRVGKHR